MNFTLNFQKTKFNVILYRSLRNFLLPTNWNRFSLSSNPGVSAINHEETAEGTNSEQIQTNTNETQEQQQNQEECNSNSNPQTAVGVERENRTIQTTTDVTIG